MGFHNDRRTNGKMPANDSSDVNIPKLFTIDMVSVKWMLILRSLNLILKFLLHPAVNIFIKQALRMRRSGHFSVSGILRRRGRARRTRAGRSGL